MMMMMIDIDYELLQDLFKEKHQKQQ